jgi:hypothetical protein
VLEVVRVAVDRNRQFQNLPSIPLLSFALSLEAEYYE